MFLFVLLHGHGDVTGHITDGGSAVKGDDVAEYNVSYISRYDTIVGMTATDSSATEETDAPIVEVLSAVIGKIVF